MNFLCLVLTRGPEDWTSDRERGRVPDLKSHGVFGQENSVTS